MIAFLLGAVVGIAVGIVGEGYWLMGRAQRLLSGQEQLQAAAEQLLALVPSKSAPRTEAPEVREPWTPFRRLAEPVPVAPRTEPVDAGMDLLDQPARRKHAAPRGK